MADSPQLKVPESPDQLVALVVDDEPIVRSMARIALEKAGLFVLTASDGKEALKVSRQFRGRIDVLVSDIAMPEMDGARLAGHLLQERPGIKVLLMSGYTRTSQEHTFLPKPFQMDEITDRVHGLLGKGVG
jgi:CheY-like chemotaxis protein